MPHYDPVAKKVVPDGNTHGVVPMTNKQLREYAQSLDNPSDTKDTAFQKHDEGKRRYELLQYDALDEIVKALEYGAKKYSDYNWLKGTEWSRYFGACMRHLTAWWMGESRDPESGLTHLAHAGACILFLITYEKRLLGKDDRVTPTGD